MSKIQKKVRLNRLLVQSGVCSRRRADKLLSEGRIQVNNRSISQLGFKADVLNDKIKIDGQLVSLTQNFVYYLFYKPKNVLTTLDDPKGRVHISDFLRGFKQRVFPVGRLDWDCEGLLILTNDGDFAHHVLHPRFAVTKTYMAKINGRINMEDIYKLKQGVNIFGKKVKAKEVVRLRKGKSQYDWVKITISEGKNQQIKRMFQKTGFDVLKLKRVFIGRLGIGHLKKGQMRKLNAKDFFRIFCDYKTNKLQAEKLKYLEKLNYL